MIINTILKDFSAGADFVSAPIDLGNVTHFSMQAVFSGSDLAGDFKLEVSNDGVVFVEVSGLTASVSSASSAVLNISDAGYRYARASWVYTSGSGNVTITLVLKQTAFY